MFELHKLKNAAKVYSKRVPERLKHDYGSHEYYTEPQVRAAVFHLNIDATYIFLAYAMFLHKQDYEALLPRLPLHLPYDEARAVFITYEPEGNSSEEFGPDRGTNGLNRTM